LKRELHSGEAVGEQGQLRFQENDGFESLGNKGEKMRKRFLMTTLTCGLIAVLAVATAYAQLPGTSLRATIPFDFSVRGKVLPAGEYQIKRITDEPGGLMISSLNDKHERAMFQTIPFERGSISSKSEIVFQRYGDNYFLSEVIAGGEETGRELLPSRQEKNLRRDLASNKTEPETVALAAY
jgi:hypothetical protein